MFGKAVNMMKSLMGTSPPADKIDFNEDLAAFVNNEYNRRQTERRPIELQWRLNYEYLAGNQYLDINPRSQAIEEIPKPFWWTEREVFNQIATIVETRISRLSRQKPILKARPASVDHSDLSSARITSMLLNSTWHDQEMDTSYNDLLIPWLELTGTVFIKTTWNRQAGRIISEQMVPQQPLDQLPDDAPKETTTVFTQGMEPQTLREGDIETCVVPPHEIYPDSVWRDDVKYCKSIIHARAYHVDDIMEMYGAKVEEESVDAITLQSFSGTGGMGYSSGTFRSASRRLKNHAIVKEYYERPSKRYPQGRFIVVAGNKTLHAGELPYQIGKDGEREIPIIRAVSIKKPGCFFGVSVIERCIPIQRRYNALRNRKAEYLNLVSIGQWYEPEGTLEDDAELNNAPGNRIRYRVNPNGAKPEPVTFPSLPASFENEISTLLAEFTAVSGVSELSRLSEAPSGVKSGVALGIAQEQDDTRFGLTSANIANSITIMGKYWVRMYRQFVQEPRLLRTVGAARMMEVREWTVSDLKSDDVLIENSAALSETPSQRRQMVFDLLNAGLFNRPEASSLSDEARQKIFQLLEFGHWETGYDDTSDLQRSRALREYRLLLDQGQMPQIRDYDDHAIHIMQHNLMRLQADYEELLMTPEGQMLDQILTAHIQQHQMMIQMQMQPMMAPPAGGEEEAPPSEAG